MDISNQTQQDIKTLESAIFDNKTIKSIPFEFFNLLFQVFDDTKINQDLKIPAIAESYFAHNKKIEALKLFRYLKQNKIIHQGDTFLHTYIQLLILRYTSSFDKYAKYVIRKIPTVTDYAILNKFEVPNISDQYYMSIDVDDIVPRLPNNEIDFRTLKRQELHSHNIAAVFSMLTSVQELSKLMGIHFRDITQRTMFPIVYKKKFEDLVMALSESLLNYFAKKIYNNLANNVPLTEILDNLKSYYKTTIDPGRYKFSADLDLLEDELNEILKSHLDKMDSLTKRSKEAIYKEFIEAILNLVNMGFQLPIYYYEVLLRESSQIDKDNYDTKYVIDLKTYNERNIKMEYISESYGFVIDIDSIEKILKYTLNNEYLYKRFLELN